MCDDGIALRVIDSIEGKLEELGLGIRCIKAETDFNYALDNIEKGDIIFILDSTQLGEELGQITQIPLNNYMQCSNEILSVHNMSLLSLIKHFKIEISGAVLAIKVSEVKFSLKITSELNQRFEQICNEIYLIIKELSLKYLKMGEDIA
jgi:hydrogenase maturation protease